MLFPAPTRSIRSAALPALLFALVAAPAAHAGGRELLTVPVTGTEPHATSTLPTQQAVSTDGERVVFTSTADNLDDGDANKVSDVWVRDRAAGSTIRVSATATGKEPNGASGTPAISADGRWVVFLTKATNLGSIATGDAAGFDLVERDLTKAPGEAGAYRVIALDVALSLVGQPSISGNGDRVAFSTLSGISGGDSDFAYDVYLRTVSTGTTSLVTGGEGWNATDPSLSADGSAVAFRTKRGISASDTNTISDVYVHRFGTGATVLASPGQTKDDDLAPQVSLSADGGTLAFATTAALVAEDTNGERDIYLRDLTAQTTTRASIAGSGAGAREANQDSNAPVLSADAGRVAFWSRATNLVPERGVGFVRLADLGKTLAPAEIDGNPAISGDGNVLVAPRALATSTTATALYAEDIEPDAADTTPPSLVVPGDLTLPATYSKGRHVRFQERGDDTGSGLVGTDCDPASGSNFPVGDTTVTCVAADAAGNETVKTFKVTIVDKVAPRLGVPTSVTLTAPDGGTTPLDTVVRAIDDVDGSAPAPTCTPATGTLLTAGTTTTVNCQVTDTAGNSAEASYPVKVVGAGASLPPAVASTVTTSERARSVAVQLTLSAPATKAIDIPVTISSGTATAGQDFSDSNQTLKIAAGKRFASVVIPITDDQRPESSETFDVHFAGDGIPEVVSTVTVTDDDGPHEDLRRRDIGPMVWVSDHATKLMVLEGAESEPKVLFDARTEQVIQPQVSPDGREVLYFMDGGLYRRPLAGGKAERIAGVGDIHANHPIWRPDGEAVAYFSHEGPATWATVVSLVDDREPISYPVADLTANNFSWNPEGTQIAFIESTEATNSPNVWAKSDVALMDADTGEIVRRYPTPENDTMPEWSPDGKTIVFLRQKRIEGGAANRWTGETVSVMNVATGAVTDLTPPADTASDSTYGPPTWSADGKAIAWVNQDERRDPQLYKPYYIATIQATGGPIGNRYDFATNPDERQPLVPNFGELEWAGLAADGPTEAGRIVFARRNEAGTASRLLSVKPTAEDERVVADLGTVSGSPAIAADGTWLAWASNRDKTDGEIYVSTPGGRAVERITDNLVADGQPSISADGSQVAFVRGTGKDRAIWLFDRESGEEERLVAAGDDGVGEPAFEPGTSSLAYVKYGDVPEIREIGLDGSGDRRLTDGTAPAFDRHSEHLAFQRAVGTGAPQVYVADATGLGAQQLTEEPGGATHPTWGPDDRSIAYATNGGIAMITTDGGQAILATQEPTDAEPVWVRPALPPNLRADDTAITEGTGGLTPAGVVLTLDRPIDDPVTVQFTTVDGTAKAPRDYQHRGPDPITIPAGDTTVTVPVQIEADPMDEPEEALTATLADAQNATVTRGTATITVRDDDDPPTLSVSDVTMPEGDLGDTEAIFQLTLSAESGWTVGVHAQTSHGTTDDDDITPTSVDVSFEPGVLTQQVHVPVHGDTQNEPDETFTLALSAQSHVTGPAAAATGKLLGDDVVGKLPDTGITSTPGPLTRTATPTFGFIGSVPRGRFECQVDDLGWTACTTPFRIRAAIDGPHVFAVRAFDGDLVDPSPATYGFTVDTIAPATTIVAGPPRISAQRQPTFKLRSDDPTARFECRLDTGEWFACSATWQPSAPLADGNHTFAARAVDPAGNPDASPAAIAFRIDSRAPETFWLQQGQTLTDTTPTSSSASVGLNAGNQPKLSLSGDGVAQVPVSCSPASTSSCTGQVTVEELPGGATKKAVRAAASAGAVLGRTTYSVAPGMTEEVAVRLSDDARNKVERKGLVQARVLVTSDGGGSAAPVPVSLTADAAAPRLLDAGTRVRVAGNGDATFVTLRVRCPKVATLPKGATAKARSAAKAKAKAACRGKAQLKVDGASAVASAQLRGTKAGSVVHLRLRLPRAAARRVARSATTPASLRLTWNTPAQAKTVDLTLTRGASR